MGTRARAGSSATWRPVYSHMPFIWRSFAAVLCARRLTSEWLEYALNSKIKCDFYLFYFILLYFLFRFNFSFFLFLIYSICAILWIFTARCYVSLCACFCLLCFCYLSFLSNILFFHSQVTADPTRASIDAEKFLLLPTDSKHDQVIFPHLASGPWVDVGDVVASRLPPRPECFLYRNLVQFELISSLQSKRRITVIRGPPGGGKTAVAIAAGHYLVRRSVLPVYFVSLAALATPEEALDAIAGTLVPATHHARSAAAAAAHDNNHHQNFNHHQRRIDEGHASVRPPANSLLPAHALAAGVGEGVGEPRNVLPTHPHHSSSVSPHHPCFSALAELSLDGKQYLFTHTRIDPAPPPLIF
jgi:hypothetical protein